MKYSLQPLVLLAALLVLPAASTRAQSVVINEFDADTPGTDEREFVELFNPGAEAVDLSAYVLVFFNGSNDAAYYAVDLDGHVIAPGGYFLLGNPDVQGTSLTFPNNTLQNGADALALYAGAAADFPRGRAPTTDGLVDAFVYGTADPTDAGLLRALGMSVQYDEAANGDKNGHSIQRVPAGSSTIVVAEPTPTGASAGRPVVSFAAPEASLREGESVTLDVTLAGRPAGEVTLRLSVLDSLGAGRADLEASVETITFAAADTVRTVTLTAVDDAVMEPLESAVVALRDIQGAVAGDGVLVLLIEPSDVPLATQTVLFDGLTGEALRDRLRTAYAPARTLGYDTARDTMYRAIDAVEKADGAQSYVVDVYTGRVGVLGPGQDGSSTMFAQGINAEHVFPQSKGAGEEPLRSDLHNLLPAEADANSLRGDYPVGEVDDAGVDAWLYRGGRYAAPLSRTNPALYSEYDDGVFEPKEAIKGDVARAVLYVAALYPDEADAAFFETQRETLLRWHRADPADSLEHRRSRRIAAYQGNVNPFVIDSTLAGRIWGGAGTPIAAESDDVLPGAVELGRNHPNPFGDATRIAFSVPRPGRAQLHVYDVLGRRVATLFDGAAQAGRSYTAVWAPVALPAGVYVVRLVAGGRHASRTVTYVR